MKIRRIIRKGIDHKVFCEDFLLSIDTETMYFGAIFDGCSSGKDSHFASSLSGKILKNILKNVDNLLLQYPKEEILYKIISLFFINLKSIQQGLGLNHDELWSTLILLVYDKIEKDVKILPLGDGCVIIDGFVHELNNENQTVEYPIDVINNHKNYIEEKEWFSKLNNIFYVKYPKDISISSDGIMTFCNTNDINLNKNIAIENLISDNRFENNESMLERKYNLLSKDGWVHKDDLSIIRIIFNN